MKFTSRRAFSAFLLCWQEVSEVTILSPAAGVQAADSCMEGSSPWAGTCMRVLSPGCPWKAFVGDVIPGGRRANAGRWGERWRCSVLLFSSTVSASWCRNRIEDGPERAAFSCSMHSKPNCYLWFQLSFFMAPIVKDTKVIKVTKLEGFCSACSRAVNVLKCFGTLASWNLNFSKGWMQNLAN